MIIRSHFNKEFEPFLGSLPDFYAVLDSIKPLTRLCVKPNMIETTKKVLNNYNLQFKKIKNGGSIFIYVSQDKDILEKYPQKDPELKDNLSREECHQFGIDLGYPKCCVKDYTGKKTSFSVKNYYYAFFKRGKYSYLQNNFLFGGSNYYLSFHKPCSMDCKKSINYNKKILNSIKKYNLEYYTKIISFLKVPQILILDIKNNTNDAWDNRLSVIQQIFSNKKKILFSKPSFSNVKIDKNIIKYVVENNKFLNQSNEFNKERKSNDLGPDLQAFFLNFS